MGISGTLFARPAMVLALAALGGHCAAQKGKGSLTKDFDKLSPKERSRIAAKETDEAAQDSLYQALMRQADADFQAKRYHEALAGYEKARAARPFNVYPKVKIEDLQALLAKQAAQAPGPAPAESPAAPTPAAEPPPAEALPARQEPLPVQEPPAPPPAPAAPPPTPPAPSRQEPAPPPVRHAQPKPAPQPGERIYMEAGAVVTERTVEDGGKPAVYKRVAHSWGQTYYFKDGHSIPGRAWSERFSE